MPGAPEATPRRSVAQIEVRLQAEINAVEAELAQHMAEQAMCREVITRLSNVLAAVSKDAGNGGDPA